MFGNSLAKEYCMLEEHYGFSHTKIRELIVQGIESSWLPASRITQPAHELVADSDWQG